MTTLLAKNAAMLVTMDHERREIQDGGIFVRDGVIEEVGPTERLPKTADVVLDMSDHVVIPGLVNTHHHLYQGSIWISGKDPSNTIHCTAPDEEEITR